MERFRRGDDTAFAALVRRHGPMVFGVCRRVLGNTTDAEDAFQATFIVLVRKAASLQNAATVGNWLYGVAYRTALEARRAAARRRLKEANVAPRVDETGRGDSDELREVLDQELSRLPRKYREVLVLCDVEGEGRKEVAQLVGCPEGTVASRLARARALLASRLTRRGVALSAAGLAVLLAEQTATASVPPALMATTVKTACLLTAGKTAAVGVLAPHAAKLAEGVLRTMLLTKIKIAATGLVLVALIAGIGTKFIPNQVQGGRPTILTGDQRRSETPKPVDPILNDRFADLWTAEDRERAPDDRRGVAPAVSGKVVAVARGGKAITVEVPPQGRGEEGKKVEIKLADNTQITYFGVGLGGAKLTEGYMAQVWTADGSKDVAVRLALVGMASVRPTPGLRGKVEKVSADGKVITLLAPATQRGQARAEGEVKEIKLTDKTTLVYSNIGMGGAKPTIGYMADVFLERGSKDAAFQINFRGEVDLPDRGRVQNRPEVAGKVVAVGGDQKTVAVEVPGGRGEEPTKREIKIGDKTTVAFMTVGPNGDKPQDGQRAMVWMAEGSKDTAARVVFVGTVKERNDTVMGQVVGVAADGKGITVQLQPMARGEDGKKVHVQFNDKTEIVFQAVGPDGAKPAEGHFVQVWLEEGSKDTAVRALFGQGGGRR